MWFDLQEAELEAFHAAASHTQLATGSRCCPVAIGVCRRVEYAAPYETSG